MVEDESSRIPAGEFFTEEGESLGTVDTSSLEKEMEIAEKQRADLVELAVKENVLSPSLAAVMTEMSTASTSGPLATLEIVRSIVGVQTSAPEIFQEGVIAYVGSGVDWHFPVALGARNIDLVDLGFASLEMREKLLESVRHFDIAAIMQGNELAFTLSLQEGKPERIRLRMISEDIAQMQDYPAEELRGVIEFAGPTKSVTPNEPVIPAIRKRLRSGAVILNHDFRLPNFIPEEHGFQTRQLRNTSVLQVASPTK